ncbi:hypothetical protein EV127DRAFT_411071 [Xylaria flabelliformis]|nr:hypothetical protein EV127DRAFT_411071 [Xylaria flabelliformis]
MYKGAAVRPIITAKEEENTIDRDQGTPFILLGDDLTGSLLAGRNFPTAFLLPGDLTGSQCKRFYDAGNVKGFGGYSHKHTVTQTVRAIGNIGRILQSNAARGHDRTPTPDITHLRPFSPSASEPLLVAIEPTGEL